MLASPASPVYNIHIFQTQGAKCWLQIRIFPAKGTSESWNGWGWSRLRSSEIRQRQNAPATPRNVFWFFFFGSNAATLLIAMQSKQVSQVTEGRFGSGIRKRFFVTRGARHIHLPGKCLVSLLSTLPCVRTHSDKIQTSRTTSLLTRLSTNPRVWNCLWQQLARVYCRQEDLPVSQLISWVAPRGKAAPSCCAALCDSSWSLES